MQNNVCSDIYIMIRVNALTCFSKKWKLIHGKLWGNDIVNSFICIFISTVQEKFPYFLSNLHQIFTALFEMFYSFYWINLNPDRGSPLNFGSFLSHTHPDRVACERQEGRGQKGTSGAAGWCRASWVINLAPESSQNALPVESRSWLPLSLVLD